MDYALLKELIGLLEQYHEQHASRKIEDFMIWLNNRLFEPTISEGHSAHNELLITFKLRYLNKELKKRTKSILSQSRVSSIDEYSFLLHLDYQESFRKMEIVDMHNLEAPTGIEIIKRLLKNGLIEEFPDQQDRRAKRIKLSQTGLNELTTLKPAIDSIFREFTSNLDLNEKIQLSGILDKLLL